MKKLTVVLLMLIIVISMVAYEMKFEDGVSKTDTRLMITAVMAYHQKVLLDPSSVKYEILASIKDDEISDEYMALRVRYRAKNAYGGYAFGRDYFYFIIIDGNIIEFLTIEQYISKVP